MISLNEEKANKFFTRLSLQPQRKFSPAFRNEIANLVLDQNLSPSFLEATCLEDSIGPYVETIRNLQISDTASPSLRLVYRMRGRPVKKSKTDIVLSKEKTLDDSPQDDTIVGIEEEAIEDVIIEAPTSVGASTSTPKSELDVGIPIDGESEVTAKPDGSKKRKRRISSSSSGSDESSEGSASGRS